MTNTLGHWQCRFLFNPDEWFGFIYRITEIDTGKQYIGKKQFTKLKRKKIKGRKNRKHVRSVSDWIKYTGSSIGLNEQIELRGMEKYKFEIESLHKTKGSLYYAEVYKQITEDVLRAKLPDGSRKYYNGYINSVKFPPPYDTEEELKHRVMQSDRDPKQTL